MINPLLIDLLVIIILAFYAWDGFRKGALSLSIELLGVVISIFLAVKFTEPFDQWLLNIIQLPAELISLIAFFILWSIIQGLYSIISNLLYPFIPELWRNSPINKAIGTIPSMGKGFLILAIVLALLVDLPIENKIKPAIQASWTGKIISNFGHLLQSRLTKTFNQELNESLKFFTTSPLTRKITQPNEIIKLPFTATNVSPDPASEAKMLTLINQEREKAGVKPLVANEELRAVGRQHAIDMLKRGYFAHINPEGKDPFDRLHRQGISFETAGENLAFAPTVELAHVGLLNSPHHLENIVEPEFGQLGMAVISAGLFGKMFVQVFTQ